MHQPVPGSEIVGSAELRESEHEKQKHKQKIKMKIKIKKN